MLRFRPLPLGVRRTAATDPAEPAAAFAPDESDQLAVGQEAERGLVWVARHIEVRDEVVFHSVAAADKLQLPLGRAVLDFAGLGGLLRRDGSSLFGVVRNSIRLSAVPGNSPQPFAF